MQIDQEVSKNLRRIRKEKGLTLDKTAELTGVSKAMLSQIERGVSSPTIARLWQIATGLNVSFSQFVIASQVINTQPDILKISNDRSVDDWVNDDFFVNVLFPYEASLGFEVYELGLKESYEHKSEAHNLGVIEHVVCVSGRMAINCDDAWHVLGEGQAIRFSGAQPHSYRNIGNGRALFHNIIHYPPTDY